ncbi:MAG: SHOCT domain-containing protein [Mangrovicoccus sp.]
MQLTQHGLSVLNDLSSRYGLSQDAVRAMMDAVSNGGGSQAQFSIPELGGMGQWQQGGMIMVGDMFNHGLQALVGNLCSEISGAYYNGSFYERPAPSQGQYQGGGSFQTMGGAWWPAELGNPSSSGAQNNMSYAIFPDSARLALMLNGQVTVYDTGQHMIGGVGQQQSGGQDLTFTSQFGTVYLNQLPIVSGGGFGQAPAPSFSNPAPQPDFPQHPEPMQPPAPMEPMQPMQPPAGGQANQGDVFGALEKLGQLRDMGVLTEDEFQSKKAELLSRL